MFLLLLLFGFIIQAKHRKSSFEICYWSKTEQKKMFAKKKCQSTWKGTDGNGEKKKCALLPTNSNCFLATHTQLDTKSEFFLPLLLPSSWQGIGSLGRQQLFDDDVFIYGSIPLFDQRILSSVFFWDFFHFRHFSTQNIPFETNWHSYSLKQNTYVCILREFALNEERKEKTYLPSIVTCVKEWNSFKQLCPSEERQRFELWRWCVSSSSCCFA